MEDMAVVYMDKKMCESRITERLGKANKSEDIV
jgi:hypothetical protein